MTGSQGRTPTAHRARGHTEVLVAMEDAAREQFAVSGHPWVPRPTSAGADPGHGVLDCAAVAVDVLWSYQAAWADECFLPTARLAASQSRLLDLVGHHPRPPLSATGLQQLRITAGAAVTVPAGFAVGAPATADAPAAVYETTTVLRADARLNDLQPFTSVVVPVRTLPPASLTAAPPPLHLASSGASLADQLASRVDAAQRGAAAARDAARARTDALALADLATTLQSADADVCPEAFAALCDSLCEKAHAAVDASAGAHAPEPLTEAQRMVMGSLARVDAAFPSALGALETALGRTDGESDAAYAARLDAMAQFLDGLVEGMLAQARDDVVRLRGPRALTVLDRTLAGAAVPGDLGVAAPGTDRVYLLPTPAGPPPAGPTTHAGLLQAGDWLVFAELVEVPSRDGASTSRRVAREAVRVVRADDQLAPLLGERATQVVFTPPLVRRYDLARTVVLGNVVPVSHGRTVVRTVTGPGPWPVTGEALAFVPDALAADGRHPEVALAVADEPWTALGEVTDEAPGTRGFTVDVLADGSTLVRPGDGAAGAAVPPGVDVRLTTRLGSGSGGNRGAGLVDQVVAPTPQVVATLNPFPVAGGADAEDPAAARRRATSSVQTLDRAVTTTDLAALLESHGLVARAWVGRDDVDRRRSLRVVVTGHGGVALTPEEHEVVARFLAERVPPGLDLHTVDRQIVLLRAAVTLALAPGADPLVAVAQARQRLGVAVAGPAPEPPGLLHPDAVRLGQVVSVSDLHRALTGVPGLQWVVVDALHRDDEPPRRAERLPLPPDTEPRWAPDVDAVEGVAVRWEEARDR